MSFKGGAALCVALALAGCKSGLLPDPNDPNAVNVVQPDVLRNNLSSTAENLFARVQKREISDEKYRELIAKYADGLLQTVQMKHVPPDRAWEYAEVFRTAKRWKEARVFLEIAVKNAPNEDRRINDTLRLAQAMAETGDVEKAIPLIRSTFDSKPTDKAPILISTLLEFTPSARGKGHDADVAMLLLDAIPQAEQTQVNPKEEAGAMFIAARPHHIQNAYIAVIELLNGVGKNELAAEVGKQLEKWESTRGQV